MKTTEEYAREAEAFPWDSDGGPTNALLAIAAAIQELTAVIKDSNNVEGGLGAQ